MDARRVNFLIKGTTFSLSKSNQKAEFYFPFDDLPCFLKSFPLNSLKISKIHLPLSKEGEDTIYCWSHFKVYLILKIEVTIRFFSCFRDLLKTRFVRLGRGYLEELKLNSFVDFAKRSFKWSIPLLRSISLIRLDEISRKVSMGISNSLVSKSVNFVRFRVIFCIPDAR